MKFFCFIGGFVVGLVVGLNTAHQPKPLLINIGTIKEAWRTNDPAGFYPQHAEPWQ